MLTRFFQLIFFQSLLLSVASSSSSSEEDEHSEEHSKRSSNGHWKYDDQDAWPSEFHDCSGKSQSPINIDTGSALFSPMLSHIELEGYDLTGKQPLMLLNNGHTLLLQLPSSMRIVKGFDSVFVAAQLHFHWGTKEVPGSEHTVDNIHYPAEIHVVHYNSKYGNISEAARKSDGLVVLGGFIGVGLQENENYEKILSALTDVSIEESDTEIPGFNVRHLLPVSLDRFYRYNGSLTTPPCLQTVNWTIFNDTITVSRKQLAALEDTLKCGHSGHLSKNFRAPQLLHGRQVLSSFSALPRSMGPRNIPPTDNGDSSYDGRSMDKSVGDIMAIAFGALFTITLLSFLIYAWQQRKKYSRLKKDAQQNVIYKPANKDEA